MKKLLKSLWKEFKDIKTLIIFLIVLIIIGSSVWFPLLLGIITNNKYWYGIAGTVELFWLAPATPFIPLCIAITFAIKKIIFKERKNN